MKNQILSIIFFFPFAICAQQYTFLSIPDSLVKHANAVVRFQETIWEIKSPAKATVKEHAAYTVLNESGDHLSEYVTSYGRLQTLNSFTGTLYNALGKEIKKIKKKDMDDQGGSGDETLMTDTRYKVAHLYDREYPYTVEFEEEQDLDGILDIDEWVPQLRNGMSVQDSRFVVIAPKDYNLRYESVNCNMQPVIAVEGEKKTYTWQKKNLPALTMETMAPTWEKCVPFVLISPSDFEAEGYKGNMSTWNSYGKFYYDLLKGRDVLPEDIRKKVHELTDHLKDDRDKIAVLYDYLQKNTHYISIQLGIGGWQPFDAGFVATKKYGDCKALSNFMVALLKEAGIRGNSVIIRAGSDARSVISNFPSDQFNHVISCVPMKNDTVWLECTSQSLPAGYLSSFTADRYGLLVDETGSSLVRTPKYGLNDNIKNRKINASIQEDGSLSATISTRYSAERQDHLEQYVNYASKEKLKEYLKNEINLPTYDLIKFDYRQKKATIPIIEEELELTAASYAQASGKRLFIDPNIMSRSVDRLTIDDERKNPVEVAMAYRDIDTVEIKIPAGFKPESVPANSQIESKFGKYTTTVNVLAEKIQYTRIFEQYNGLFPVTDYNDLAKFYEKVYKADRREIVLVRQE